LFEQLNKAKFPADFWMFGKLFSNTLTHFGWPRAVALHFRVNQLVLGKDSILFTHRGLSFIKKAIISEMMLNSGNEYFGENSAARLSRFLHSF
jgi:hypothetical protein